jgi:hypothetical protein
LHVSLQKGKEERDVLTTKKIKEREEEKGWNCPRCPYNQPRHWNVERHIWRHHDELGEPVDGFGNTRRQQYQMKTNRKFAQNYNNQHKPRSFPRQFNKSNVSNARTYEMDYKLSWDFMDDLSEPFKKLLDFTKVIAELARLNQHSYYPRPYPVNYQYPVYLQPLNYSHLVVGYLGYVCKNCLVIEPLPMCLSSIGLFQTPHQCSPQRLQDVHGILDKETKISQLYANLPEVMKKVVNGWTNNQSHIFAVEVQKEEISNHNVVDLDITTIDKNSWAARALKYKQTMLTEEELLDFLKRCNYNTFSYFKVPVLFHHQVLPLYYTIGIVNQSMLKSYIERSIDKSNYQVSNNISSIPTPETEMTLEEFFLTTKSYYSV